MLWRIILGRKNEAKVLSRISSALVKFVSPMGVSTQAANQFVSKENKENKKKNSQNKENKEKKSHLRLVSQEKAPSHPAPSIEATDNPWVRLMSFFKEIKSSPFQKEGLETYQDMSTRNKKGGKTQKGVILDQTSE